jgi:hypothetical protein
MGSYRIYGPTQDCKDNCVWIAHRHYDCTHIYGLSDGGHSGLPALMDSALFLLNTFTTCWRSVR